MDARHRPNSRRTDRVPKPIRCRRLRIPSSGHSVVRARTWCPKESAALRLSFDSGKLDYIALSAALAEKVLDGPATKREYQRHGIALYRHIAPTIGVFFFNLDTPLVGGYTPQKIALRRAISMSYDRDTAIKQLLNGQGIPANQPVVPPLYEYDPKYVARYGNDPAAAPALLDRFGYKDRDGDGYRSNALGAPCSSGFSGGPLTRIKRHPDRKFLSFR